MPCRTLNPRKTEDGRIIVDSIDQVENEEYHDFSVKLNHDIRRVPSAIRPGWMNVTCPCGMKITIAPEVEAYLDQIEIVAED
jgi:hypothetical protein